MDDPATIPDVTALDLKSHRAAFLLASKVLTYDGDSLTSTEGMLKADVCLVATLRDDEGNVLDIDGERVYFGLTADSVRAMPLVSTASTDGIASLTTALSPAVYAVDAIVPYLGVSGSGFTVVYDPKDSFAAGGGWVMTGEDGLSTYPMLRANFGFMAKPKTGVFAGHLEFCDQKGLVNLRSSSIDLLEVTEGKDAQFNGRATVNGETGHWYVVKAGDNGEPGTQDTFEISIWAPGADPDIDEPWFSAGDILQGGNVVVYPE